jgi:ankyrin repeat protein
MNEDNADNADNGGANNNGFSINVNSFASARDAYLVYALVENPPNYGAARQALERGANINVPACEGGSRLIDWACRRPVRNAEHNEDLLIFLLEHGADTNRCSPLDGLAPIHVEVNYRNIARAQLLLTMGNADPNLVMEETRATISGPVFTGLTPLQVVLHLGRSAEMVRLLVDHGAHLNFMYPDGSHSLHHVKTVPMLEFLLEHVADLNTRNSEGKTPLYEMCRRPNTNFPLIQTLVQAGADPNLSVGEDKKPPLHLLLKKEWGTEAAQLENIKWLIQVGGADPLFRDARGRSALHWACWSKNVALVCWMLDHCGATVFSTANDDYNVLHYACRPMPVASRGDPAGLVIELLQRHPHLLDIKSSLSYGSALHCAATWSPQLCRLLVDKYRFRPDDRHALLGFTALHVAVFWGTKDTVATMIELVKARELNLDEADANSCTPLHWAVIQGCPAKIRLLLESGSNVNKMDNHGATPLAYASVLKHSRIDRTRWTRWTHLFVSFADIWDTMDRERPDLSIERGASAEICDLLVEHGANARCERHPYLLAASVGNLDGTFLIMRAAARQGLFGGPSYRAKEQKRHPPSKRKHAMGTRSSKRLRQSDSRR